MLSSAVLRAEWQRRTVCGLDAHPQLADFAISALEAEAQRRGVDVQRAAWYAPTDDRQDPWLLRNLPPQFRRHLLRVCYLVGASAITSRSQGRVRLHHQTYGSYNSLCPTERFWCQPAVIERRPEGFGSFGYSGFLLGHDTVLTCWHGWAHFAQEPQVAIFDYAARKPCDQPVELPEEQVVTVEPYPVLQPSQPDRPANAAGDWVVLRLQRPRPAPPVTIAKVNVGTAVYTLGHPLGLPLKLADRARVLSADDVSFRADLDTFTGNSGSPVFDAESHALVGLVVEGQKDQGDFEPSPTKRCYVTNRIDHLISGQLVVAASSFFPPLAAVAS